MCGIGGLIDAGGVFSTDELQSIAARMGTAVSHRGPDDSGTWVDGATRTAFGHRRLAILDLSEEGHQPMSSSCGRYVLSFNGEIYNFREIRRRLESAGRSFRGNSDTEVMVEAFSEWGFRRALSEFNGMFAFSLFDRSESKLLLARDRLGEKPLYYGWIGRSFVFGSELKALRAHPHFVAEIDRGALSLFLRHSYVPAPLSIYRGIKKLPPASFVQIDPAAIGHEGQPVPYWSLVVAMQNGIGEVPDATTEEAETVLDELLGDAVRLRMEADVPLGAFLSGGIDSSTVVAMMQAQSSRPVRTFTIGFNEEPFDEAVHARKIARHLGTDHTEMYVTPQHALDVIPDLPRIYDEPFSDSSQIPTVLLADLTRRHVTVSLSGDGGDEVFGGYPQYAISERLWRASAKVPRSLKRPSARILRSLSADRLGRIYPSISPLLPRRLRRNPTRRFDILADSLLAEEPERIHRILKSNWHDPSSVVLGGWEPGTILTEPKRADIPDIRQRLMCLDALTYLPDDILVKVDRAAMAFGLESRVPILDHRIPEFLWRLPVEVRMKGDKTKWLLRRVLYRYVPKELVERPKMGFSVPIDSWLRGPLRDWTESLIAPSRIRREGFFDPSPIVKLWHQHLAGAHEWGYLLWDVLMFQSWLEASAIETTTA